MRFRKLTSFFTILALLCCVLALPATATAGAKVSWPKQAVSAGLPELKKGTLVTTQTAGNVTSIAFTGVKRSDIDPYLKQLVKSGYRSGIKYPGGISWNYVKTLKKGYADVMITFQEGTVTILLQLRDGKPVSGTKTTDKLTWLAEVPKEVPVFTKGTLTEATPGTQLPTMVFKDVKKADLEAYKKALVKAGFTLNKGDSDASLSYQYLSKDQTRIIVVTMTYEDGYLTLRIISTP